MSKEKRGASSFGRRYLQNDGVTLSAIGCPLCGCEMNADIKIKTIYGSISGPRVALTMRLQCNAESCKYYERISADANDNETIKEVERQVLQFETAIPSMGRWNRSKVSNGKYAYRWHRRQATDGNSQDGPK